MAEDATGSIFSFVPGLITAALARLGITSSGVSSPTVTASTAVVIGAATTAGVRLDLESGDLAVREGDDSDYGNTRGRDFTSYNSNGNGFTNSGGLFALGPSGGPVLDFSSSGVIRWSSTGVYSGTRDTGLARVSAGIAKVTDGSSGLGKLQVADGTAALPAITGADVDSGIVFGSNTVALSTGGTARLSLANSAATFAVAGSFSGNELGDWRESVFARTADGTESSSIARLHITNEAAAGAVDRTIPTAVAGKRVVATVEAAQYLRLTAVTGDVIRGDLTGGGGATTTSATGGYIRSNVVGSTVTLEAINATTWQIISIGGTWTIDS